jgi:hypothetical protein
MGDWNWTEPLGRIVGRLKKLMPYSRASPPLAKFRIFSSLASSSSSRCISVKHGRHKLDPCSSSSLPWKRALRTSSSLKCAHLQGQLISFHCYQAYYSNSILKRYNSKRIQEDCFFASILVMVLVVAKAWNTSS